jgi:ABC-2 type transport system ATP-binding protein
MRSPRETGAATAVTGDETPVIVVRDLRMAYGSHEAVHGIDLDVRRGEIFVFLGPNGAGKTTTVEILEGYRRRTGGAVSVLGADPQSAGSAWRARVGVVLQESQPEPGLTVRECLSLHAGYYMHPRRIDETIALAGLADKADARGRELSGSEKRRVDVALALVGDPELIFLDEPTTGADPAARRAAWSVIAALRDLGKTVFLTTRSRDEANALADRIAALCGGQIVATGTPPTLAAGDRATSRISSTLPGRAHAGRAMSAVITHQARYELLSFWRSPQGPFFALALPIILLVLLTWVFGDAAYYAGHLAALGVISAAFASLVVSVTIERERAILKRRRAAPVSAGGLIAGRVTSATIVAGASVALLLVVAWIAYDVTPRVADLPAILLATMVGAAAFACLGYALASFICSAHAASPVAQAILLPMYLISGVLVPSDELPSPVLSVADAFPVRHLAQALSTPLDPATSGEAIEGADLLVVAIWGLAGLVVATRHFSWAPRSAATPESRAQAAAGVEG